MKKIFSFIIGQTDTVHCSFKKDKFNILCKDKYNSNQIRITFYVTSNYSGLIIYVFNEVNINISNIYF